MMGLVFLYEKKDTRAYSLGCRRAQGEDGHLQTRKQAVTRPGYSCT